MAVNSATSALHLSCVALGITKNDIVWISANGFVATSNCALYCGAKINFIDVDKYTGNISLKILKKLETTKKIPSKSSNYCTFWWSTNSTR